MPEYNAEQITLALTAARAMSEARAARRREVESRQAELFERSYVRLSRRALDNHVASYLGKEGGVEAVQRFDALREQHQAALLRAAAERKAEAVQQSPRGLQTLQAAVGSRRKAAEQLATQFPTEILDKPFLIWWTQGIDFPDIHVEPMNSRAKFRFRSGGSLGFEEMSFYYLWANPSGEKFAVINVDGFLIVNGFCLIGSDGGFWPGDRRSSLGLTANLSLWEWWNQPPTQPFAQPDQSQQVLHLSTNTGGFGDPGALEFKEIFRGYDLRHEQFLLPPGGVVVIEVALSITYGSSDGNVDVDFETGDFHVSSPVVLLRILT